MTEFRVTYDPGANAAYVYLSDPQSRVASKKVYACDPIEVGGMINLDFDEEGRLVGIEVLAARSKLAHYVLDGAEAPGGDS
ncbi:hypothetical protein Ais01nite_02270 [Asanoa ishikariensis]|uniref:Uncharacterized protein YuzE n=1 Tax=Asanoa ishikariensis TaxID=137265 RepID=A0A1H3TLV4_9ACTN|nr:DUF2283 domain-containing protein [Asanoa ishikariensis]GIF62192.1 hypothetical protein Ais01nite_02270 [Asanoa ishikariensis]SDZ50977.1 Uncharacterized protein YuzE [Asanoa ishikariensis]